MTALTLVELADRGFVRGARVGVGKVLFDKGQTALGTIIAVGSANEIHVIWDDHTREMHPHHLIAPNGYVADEQQIRQTERAERRHWRAMQQVAV